MAFGGAAYFLNLAAFHIWAAGGPPTPNPEWHRMWGNRFAWLTLFLLCLGVGLVASALWHHGQRHGRKRTVAS
jgi:hypothetical protein